LKEKPRATSETKKKKTMSNDSKVTGDEMLALALRLRRNKMNTWQKSVVQVNRRTGNDHNSAKKALPAKKKARYLLEPIQVETPLKSARTQFFCAFLQKQTQYSTVQKVAKVRAQFYMDTVFNCWRPEYIFQLCA
jgi:acetylornithine/succinyldiaminopimelate/putrescine aminotransferase